MQALIRVVLTSTLLLAGCLRPGLPGRSFQGPLPPADEALSVSASRIERTIEVLATEIGPRSFAHQAEALERAQAWITEELRGQGYRVDEQPVIRATQQKTANLIATLPGRAPELAPLIVGAHYDTVWSTPGADDNASGVAALLELTRMLQGTELERTVLFIAWTTEEPPYFTTPSQGSVVHAKSLQDGAYAALSLETIGMYSDERRSQRYPFPLSMFFPGRGDFVAFVSDNRSRALLRETARSFRDAEDFPTRGGSAPRWLTGIDWSDHRSHWAVGVPALMVTDTALFRNPNYHEPDDVPAGVDPEAVARITRGLRSVILQLARAR